jgi:hypothetical protein
VEQCSAKPSLNGGFLDRGVLFGFIRVIDVEAQTAYVWGDGKQAMDWTTFADTARYAAEVALDERSVPRKFWVAGDVLDFEGIVSAYESASGKKLRFGDLARSPIWTPASIT